MKKLLLLLLCVPFIFSTCKKEDLNNTGPKTYVPDDGFEQELIDRGYDDVLDDYVLTANISSVTSLGFGSSNTVHDLTGIEDFTALRTLECADNPITHVDISHNTNLNHLNLYNTPLYSLDLRNGLSDYSNNGLLSLWVTVGANHNLTCVSVDNVAWANENLLASTGGGGAYYFIPEPTFSTNCN